MHKSSHQSFTELHVWKKAREFKREILTLAKTFPAEEKYCLYKQIVNSVRSVAANIAEGHGRYTYKDQIHFCIQARGSLSETLNHLIDAFDCKYLSEEQLSFYKNKYDEIERLLNGYITFLRSNMQ